MGFFHAPVVYYYAMRFDTSYRVVVEFDYPLDSDSELAHDTWGRDIKGKVNARFETAPAVRDIRVVRTGAHLKVSMVISAWAVVASALEALLAVIMPSAPSSLVVHLEEVDVKAEREEQEALL